jgi:hypothetical protein
MSDDLRARLDSWEEDRFARLHFGLKIDMLRLDEEIVQLASNVQEACEWAAKAIAIKDEVKNSAAVAKAFVTRRLRQESGLDGGKVWSDARLDKEVILEPEALQAERDIIDAEAFAAKWQSLVKGWLSKQESLKNISMLTNSGFLAPNVAYNMRREELARIREQSGKMTTQEKE